MTERGPRPGHGGPFESGPDLGEPPPGERRPVCSGSDRRGRSTRPRSGSCSSCGNCSSPSLISAAGECGRTIRTATVRSWPSRSSPDRSPPSAPWPTVMSPSSSPRVGADTGCTARMPTGPRHVAAASPAPPRSRLPTSSPLLPPAERGARRRASYRGAGFRRPPHSQHPRRHPDHLRGAGGALGLEGNRVSAATHRGCARTDHRQAGCGPGTTALRRWAACSRPSGLSELG